MRGADESIPGSVGSTSSSLLERVRLGDEQAWTRLVRLYGPLVDDWLRGSRLDENDRNDVFQEVFRSVAESIGCFSKGRPGDSFRAWLRTLTGHRLADHFRRRCPDAAPGGTEPLRRLENLPQTQPLAHEDHDAIDRLRRRAMELLRGEFEPKTWDMFWRIVVGDEAVTEVAADLGVSRAAVRMAKSRVLRRLRDELEGLDELP